jgi:microcystin-dependent protein
MAEPFLSEIRIMSFNFPPKGWAFCNGQLLPINQNQALFALLGTNYGGNGQTNFALPDLRGRTPIHRGGGFTLGQRGGSEAVTLGISQLPAHAHALNARAPDDPSGNTNLPGGNFFSNSAPAELYNNESGTPALQPTNSGAVGSTGGSQAHNNMAPYIVLNFCIALQGIFPSQN